MIDFCEADRRQWPRRRSEECPWLLDAKLRSGTEVSVIDISNGGVLLEAASQILPGARVELFLIGADRRWLVKGRIIRCQVASILPENGVRYRAALVFNEPVSLIGGEADQAGAPVPALAGLRGVAVPAPLMLPAA